MAVAQKVVPVSDPAHPSHNQWLEGLLLVLKALTSIAPAVVSIAVPGAGPLAQAASAEAIVLENKIP